jgi:hypothetical protein
VSPPQAGSNVIALFAVLIAVAGNVAVFATSHSKIESNKDQIGKLQSVLVAACQRRAALDRDIASTAALLRATRGDPTIYGYPRVLIVDRLRLNRVDRATLSILKCE